MARASAESVRRAWAALACCPDPAPPAVFVGARALARRKKYAAAIALLQAWLRRCPGDVRLTHWLAGLHYWGIGAGAAGNSAGVGVATYWGQMLGASWCWSAFAAERAKVYGTEGEGRGAAEEAARVLKNTVNSVLGPADRVRFEVEGRAARLMTSVGARIGAPAGQIPLYGGPAWLGRAGRLRAAQAAVAALEQLTPWDREVLALRRLLSAEAPLWFLLEQGRLDEAVELWPTFARRTAPRIAEELVQTLVVACSAAAHTVAEWEQAEALLVRASKTVRRPEVQYALATTRLRLAQRVAHEVDENRADWRRVTELLEKAVPVLRRDSEFMEQIVHAYLNRAGKALAAQDLGEARGAIRRAQELCGLLPAAEQKAKLEEVVDARKALSARLYSRAVNRVNAEIGRLNALIEKANAGDLRAMMELTGAGRVQHQQALRESLRLAEKELQEAQTLNPAEPAIREQMKVLRELMQQGGLQ